MNTIFFRLLAHEDKGAALLESVAGVNAGDTHVPDTHVANPQSFRQVPGSPFAYWVSEDIRAMFKMLQPFGTAERQVWVGLQTSDDFRFVRLRWECFSRAVLNSSIGLDQPPESFHRLCRSQTYTGKIWVPFAKGGDFSPYYADLHLTVNWGNDGEQVKEYITARYPYLNGKWEWVAKNPDKYFYLGITWPRRTTSGISIRPLPSGCIFGEKGPAVLASSHELAKLLGLMNSKAFEGLVSLQLGAADVAARSYEVGLIQTTPIPTSDVSNGNQLSTLALRCAVLKRSLDTAKGTSHAFQTAALLQVEGSTLAERAAAWQARVAETEKRLTANQAEIDEIAYRLYGISDEDRQAMEASRRRPTGLKAAGKDQEGVGEEVEDKVDVDEEVDDKEGESGANSSYLVPGLLSYAVGCAFGRWDVRIGLDRSLATKLADPFAPLPVCSPATLVGPDALPARPGDITSEEWMRARPDAITLPPEGSVTNLTIPDDGYPLPIPWEGILVDDPDHPDDLVRRVRSVLDLLFGDRAEAIEREACAVLGMKELRDYFSNPKAFFDYHVKAYSKSRRKAPIYWLLQSSRRSYGLWLYYHRLDSDLLFHALVNYVEPKLRLEESRLDQLRAQRSEVGASGSAARGLERAIDRQEALLSELHDFRDRLDRAANLHLSPDLDDGVVLNIAPLRELVPWKVARDYWEELQKGRYEWSSVSKQLRARGVI